MLLQGIWLILFAGASAVTIFTAGTSRKIRFISKPLCLPLLAGYYLSAAPEADPLVLIALFFGFLGDLFLLRQKRRRMFLAGLAAFLAGHVVYTLYFAGTIVYYRLVSPWFFLALLFYLAGSAGILWLLKGNPRSIRGPVIGYLCVISLLNFTVLGRLWSYSGAPFWLPLAGTLLFMASDSLIAYRNFHRRLSWISRAVSLTYLLAQFFLIRGILLTPGFAT